VLGKMAFLLFVGFMSFSLGVVGIIAMCYLYVCYIGQLYLYFKFPRLVYPEWQICESLSFTYITVVCRFEEYLRKMHYFGKINN
jgi:hypothetical protein